MPAFAGMTQEAGVGTPACVIPAQASIHDGARRMAPEGAGIDAPWAVADNAAHAGDGTDQTPRRRDLWNAVRRQCRMR
jgi:hypothetical protein